jgi:hypothetical protein
MARENLGDAAKTRGRGEGGIEKGRRKVQISRTRTSGVID